VSRDDGPTFNSQDSMVHISGRGRRCLSNNAYRPRRRKALQKRCKHSCLSRPYYPQSMAPFLTNSLQYERNPMPFTHRIECVYGITGAYAWMRDRHTGKPIVPGCSTVSMSVESLQGNAETLLIRGIIGNVLALFGSKIGLKVADESWEFGARSLSELWPKLGQRT
jgi:hypothetical protein